MPETFRFLQLAISDTATDLQTCISNHLEVENINYHCSGCNNETNNTKKQLFISAHPSILIINLLRFQTNDEGILSKNNAAVAYPLQLNLKVNNDENTSETLVGYNLYAISNHRGTINGGHYYTHCLNDNVWIELNDSVVTTITPALVESATRQGLPYILFYKRHEANSPSVA